MSKNSDSANIDQQDASLNWDVIRPFYDKKILVLVPILFVFYLLLYRHIGAKIFIPSNYYLSIIIITTLFYYPGLKICSGAKLTSFLNEVKNYFAITFSLASFWAFSVFIIFLVLYTLELKFANFEQFILFLPVDPGHIVGVVLVLAVLMLDKTYSLDITARVMQIVEDKAGFIEVQKYYYKNEEYKRKLKEIKLQKETSSLFTPFATSFIGIIYIEYLTHDPNPHLLLLIMSVSTAQLYTYTTSYYQTINSQLPKVNKSK